MASASLARVEGWPRLPGAWEPWHDGLILPNAILRFMDRRQPGWSTTVPAGEIDRIQLAYADAVAPILNDVLGTVLTVQAMIALRYRLVAACRSLYLNKAVPTDLTPVFNINGSKIDVLWRDGERERELFN